jgi:hypothetical protein
VAIAMSDVFTAQELVVMTAPTLITY